MLENQSRSFYIQLLRSIACIGVYLVHLGIALHLQGPIRAITDYGRYGVYLFFIISGYLAMQSTDLREGRIRSYFLKRAFSILPIYYAVILINLFLFSGMVPGLSSPPTDSMHLGWLRYLFLISNMVPEPSEFWTNLNGTWTMGSFAFFYLLMPLIYKFINSYRRSILAFFSCYILFLLQVRVTDWFAAAGMLYYFLLGVAVHFARLEKREWQLILLCTIALIYFSVFGKTGPLSNAFLFVLLFIAGVDIALPPLLKKLVAFVDRYSFSIYLVHPIFTFTLYPLYTANYASPLWFDALLLTALTGVSSVLLYHFVQRPADRLKQRLL